MERLSILSMLHLYSRRGIVDFQTFLRVLIYSLTTTILTLILMFNGRYTCCHITLLKGNWRLLFLKCLILLEMTNSLECLLWTLKLLHHAPIILINLRLVTLDASQFFLYRLYAESSNEILLLLDFILILSIHVYYRL